MATKVIRKKRSIESRFWTKVAILDSDKCWIWQGGKTTKGYGIFHGGDDQGSMLAHRVSWILHYGDIPFGMIICHFCDNPSCVNPLHLWLGNYSQNTIDAIVKGRTHYLVVNGNTRYSIKLTEKQVIKIRNLYSSGKASYNSLAKEYGVHFITIRDLLKRYTWKHISAEEKNCV